MQSMPLCSIHHGEGGSDTLTLFDCWLDNAVVSLPLWFSVKKSLENIDSNLHSHIVEVSDWSQPRLHKYHA